MITDTWRVDGVFDKRFVRADSLTGRYFWCERDALNPQFDIAQGTCDAHDLPDDVRIRCDSYQGAFYACEWPK